MYTPFAMASRGLALLRLTGWLLAVAVWAVPGLDAAELKFITVSASAVPGYVRPLDAQGKPQAESYIFTQGRYFAGLTADAGLEQVKFDDILKTLAPSLAKQNYFPAKEVPTADLLIMVHWGTTTVYEDPQKAFQVDRVNDALGAYRASADGNNGNADPGALNQALGDQAAAQASAEAVLARNSALLGYKPDLEREQRKLFPSTGELTMTAELNEERYFVILMAYDYRRMRTEHKSHLLWATRISVRSPGSKFIEAMPALVQAGANVFGRKVDGLVRVDGRTREGRVDLGEMKIIGTVEDPQPGAPKK